MRARLLVPMLLLLRSAAADAHPVPFSYVDVRVQPGAIELTLVAHVFDLGHDLQIAPPERLLEGALIEQYSDALTSLVRGRIQLAADGVAADQSSWSVPEALAERQSLRWRARYPLPRAVGRVNVGVVMFPYDPQHRTFLNIYEDGRITAQAILDNKRTGFEYFSGTQQGLSAVIARFLPSGIHHILIGPDHLLFLVGLMLLGGSLRQLLVIVTAFTIGHSITLSLAALGLVIPPASAIEPAIALSVVYVGADNLLVSAGGRDTRAWVAAAFGLIHGFGFANVLREMDLPARALGWTLFSFNIGVEIGQLLVVAVVASLFAWIRSRSAVAGRWLTVTGSVVVILAGAFWFVQRVFFSGGTA